MISHNWSPMKRLIWLRGSGITGGSGTWDTISGNPVSFTAKAAPLRQLSVAFSPVQDLHGYDSPWPAGGGANKFDKTVVSTGYIDDTTGELKPHASSKSSDYIPVSAGASYRIVTEQTIGMWGAWYDENKTYISGFTNYLENPVRNAPTGAHYVRMTIVFSGNGNVDTFAFNNPSTVTTYSPYSNICPISGWSSLTVEQRGKNLLNPDISAYSANVNYRYLNSVVPDGQVARMTITDKDTSVDVSGCYIGFTDTDLSEYGTVSHSKWVIDNGVEKTNATNTTGSGGTIIMSNVFIYPKTQEAFDKLFARYNIMVELGETATEYTPYNPSSRSISISLGQTVYSGYVDVCTGQGEIDSVSIVFDGSADEEIANQSSATAKRISIKLPSDSMVWEKTNEKSGKLLSNEFSETTNALSYAGTVGVHYRANGAHELIVGFGDVDWTSVVTEARAWLSSNPLQVVYWFATPQTFHMTPQEVQSLLGDNTMWSNANQPITVEYRKN